MFIFARRGALYNPAVHFRNAAYCGQTGLVKQDGDKLIIEWGDADAAFSRLVYDGNSDDIVITSDIAGQMTLRYAVIGDAVYVASHDILLAPYVPFAVDEESLAHIRRSGWSVGGCSLVKGITVCRPGETVLVSDRVRTDPAVYPADGCARTAALEYLAARLPNDRVTVELSAGFDSRAALAATLACKDAANVRAFSEGPEDSQDVTVAREICRRHGIAFEHRDTRRRDPQDILDDWSRAAVLNNGHIEINILASRGAAEPTVCGDGGEIHRGYFYPYRPFQRLLGPPPRDALSAVAAKLGPSDRLSGSIDRLSASATSAAEVLDRFYMTERFGVWNQKLAREASHRISPFYARSSMVGLGSGLDCALHVDLIRRYLPKAMGIPINGEASPSLYAKTMASAAALEVRIFLGKLARRVSRGADLSDSRESAINPVLNQLPPDFLFEGAHGWAEYGAQRFLKLYQNAGQMSECSEFDILDHVSKI